jgi:DNA primase
MADTVQKIKEKLSIVDVVSPYVKLTKSGRTLKGLSPFNKEKTPSFYVNPERGTYYCFSSGQGGDHFEFIEKMEGVDFKGALKILAEKAGVEIEYTGGGKAKEERSKLDRLRDAMAAAERFFARNLIEGSAAHEYALSRGLTKENIASWNLGFAPDAWRGLLEALTAEGFTMEELLGAGLIKEADEKRGTFYDRFRNRLMFPIRDAAGRTVAFTGRALSKDDQAKYLNSPETDLYKKSHVLFGMDKAKDAIRQRGFALLVEGQFDLTLLHQIGFTNTIALSGTALSHEHLSLIKRYAENLMLALDADRAGLAASAKNAQAALRAGMRVKAVRLPEGKDPADLASSDPKEFAKRVQDAESIIEFFLAVLTAAEKDLHRLVISAEKIVLPLVKSVQSPMEREHFISIVARSLASTPEAVRASLIKVPAIIEEGATTSAQAAPAVRASSTAAESRGIMMLAAAAAYPDTLLAKRLVAEYNRINGSSDGIAIPERAIFEASLLYGEQPHENAGDDLIRSFEQAVLTDRLAAVGFKLRQAEVSNDEEALTQATTEWEALRRSISSLS